VYVTRHLVNDGARYFGPFTDVAAMRRALNVVKRIFTVRSCNYDMPRVMPERPCLDYHIGRCQAPCVGLQTMAQYRAMIDEILLVLEGETEAIRGQVETRMRGAADALDFERAAQLRDVIQGLDGLAREQRVHRLGAQRGGSTQPLRAFVGVGLREAHRHRVDVLEERARRLRDRPDPQVWCEVGLFDGPLPCVLHELMAKAVRAKHHREIDAAMNQL